MIDRDAQAEVIELLGEFPAVALIGPRQVGKTTLAEKVAKRMDPASVYLDLETPSDLSKLADPEQYFELQKGKLIILDEIQRAPEIFTVLRGVIDRRRKQGYGAAQFLILGSASLELLKQSSESLAGRIAYKELTGLTVLEIRASAKADVNSLWLRGGFPDSFLAKKDEASFRWRSNFITTYLERDVPQFGPRIPAAALRRLWTMLAHSQGGQVNVSKLGAALDVSTTTAKRYLELLEDLLLIRTVRPWSGNVGKRLVKSPKIYIRDSGLTHALLNITTMDDLVGHPIVGASWEAFVMENLLAQMPLGASAWFYRTSAGAEIDLVIEGKGKRRIAIEIKKSMAPVASKGFYLGCHDIKATNCFIVYSGEEEYPVSNQATVISLPGLMGRLKEML